MDRIPDSPDEKTLEQLLEKRPRPAIGDYVAPRDELERAVCELWSEVLLVARVGRNDNILDLGADSLHMAVIGARLSDSYGMEIQIGDFFEYATVAGIAALLRARPGNTWTTSGGPPQIE